MRQATLLAISGLPCGVIAEESERLAEPAGAAPEKPWLITPTVSSNPKLGAEVGVLAAYLKQLDARSTPSMTGLSATYSDTDSSTLALFSQLYWGGDGHRLALLAATAEVNNEYDDFLGSGQSAETRDSVHTVGFRYLTRLSAGGWFAGAQAVSTNYVIGADGALNGLLNQIGLSGFDAIGIGLVLEHDATNHQRDPSSGHRFTLHNFAYRESLGGESSFDVGYAQMNWYTTSRALTSTRAPQAAVIGVQIKGRLTNDAPLSGYSSVSLPGYTVGNYLATRYSHVLVDGRIPLSGGFGVVAFAGVGCLYGHDIAQRSLSCGDAVYPSAGFGLSYMLKKEASIVIRLELAKGKNDNEALYLRFGHSFKVAYGFIFEISQTTSGDCALLQSMTPPPLRTATLLAVLISPLAGALSPTAQQSSTLKELVEVIEERHYASRRYDDGLSAQHFAAYLDALDPQRMFFDADDVTEFSEWRLELDNAGRRGDLNPAFTMFNRYQTKLELRLNRIVDTLPDTLERFDYDVEEYLVIDHSTMPWATNAEELDDRWRKRLKNQALSLKLAGKADEDIPGTLEKRYRNQLSRFDQYNAQDVFQIYANTLAEQYDPHTNYFSPRRAENFDINMSLSFEGIGAILQIDDEYAKVTRLVPAGPADKQGELKPSDLIIGVGQGEDGPVEDVVGWRLDEVVDLIRGPRDTTVRLEVIPGKAKMEQRKVVAIKRNEVKLEEQAAQKDIIEFTDAADQTHRVGVIDIPAFYIDFEGYRAGNKDYRSTTRDVQKLIDELVAEGVEGLVIDLRDNGGGSLQEANQLTGLFIEFGPTVQIRSAESRVWRDGKRRRSSYYEGPVAVIINRLSASASEIFAGAIQDYGRGVIVGERSFGKGTVQSLLPLQEGQLKITESKFYRISGDSTQHRGVIPDIEFPSLFDPTQIGESALDNALSWDQIAPARFNRYSDYSAILPTLTTLHERRAANDPDYLYLEERALAAQEARSISALPLQETGRIAMRDEQEAKALAIENKRRLAKGLEPLASFDEESEPLDDIAVAIDDASADGQTDDTSNEEEESADVLLLEAGRILIDAISLRPDTSIAGRAR